MPSMEHHRIRGYDLLVCQFVAAIGHENPLEDGQFGIPPFFIGEAALYYFTCESCKRVSAASQPT